MDIKMLIFCFVTLAILSCGKEQNLKKFKYCTDEQDYCVLTVLDTAKLKGRFFQHFTSNTVIREYDTLSNLAYNIAFGNLKPDDDWNPFNTYSYDTAFVRRKLNLHYNKPPVYFITLEKLNHREYVTVCRELPGLGITIESNYYSDTLNILFMTTFINEFNFSKVDKNKHYEIFSNSDIIRKDK